MTDILGNVVTGLVFVIGFILIGAYLYSYMFGLKIKGNKGVIRIMTNCPLGPKKSIAVVKVMDEYLVLGVTPDSITYLTRIESIEGISELEAGAEVKVLSGFKGIVNAIKGNIHGPLAHKGG